MGRNVLEIPPELKKITPYVRRAEELDQDKSNPESRLVSYYARQFAVYVGIPNSKQGGEAAKKCLGTLLGQLEKEKPVMDTFTRDESKYVCRNFALKVFDMADGEDRMGMANKNTAKTFYAAATFLELLAQFYPDDDASEDRKEEKKRLVYAKWKATDILKAIKEGRQPSSGGYGEEDGEEEEEEVVESNQVQPKANGANGHNPSKFVLVDNASDDDEEKKDSLPPPMSALSPVERNDEKEEEGYEIEDGPPPAYPGEVSHTISVVGFGEEKEPRELPQRFQPPPAKRPTSPPTAQAYRPPIKPVSSPPRMSIQPPPPVQPSLPATVSNFFGLGKKDTEVSKAQLKDAIELTRFALSALEDKDLDLGVSRLQQALKCLGRY